MQSNKCGTVSPGGMITCGLLAGHHEHGQPLCKNPSTGHSWCGYCGEWSCKLHGVNMGPDQISPAAYEPEAMADAT